MSKGNEPMTFTFLLEIVRYQLKMMCNMYGKIDQADVNNVINSVKEEVRLKLVEDKKWADRDVQELSATA